MKPYFCGALENFDAKMKKYLGYYISPFIFLILVIGTTWYLFFNLIIVTDNEKRLAGVFAVLGLGFGVFQFWFNKIHSDKSKLFDLKYNTYKEFIFIIDSISEIINTEMSGERPIAVHGLVSRLLNQINRFNSSINVNRDYLFPDIEHYPETDYIQNILKNILSLTDDFRVNIERANKNESEVTKEFITNISTMNWHNSMRDRLKEMHDKKYGFYKVLRTYL